MRFWFRMDIGCWWAGAGWCALLLLALPAVAAEHRCGWLDNPTPANLWLRDRDGEWTLSQQGLYVAPGMDNLPRRRPSEWVVTNGTSYGYGCVCLRVELDRDTRNVLRVLSGTTLPLSRCRTDPNLPPMPG